MLNYEPWDLFLNTDTGEIDTFYLMTEYETSKELTDEELESEEENLLTYFEDMENEGVFLQVFEILDPNTLNFAGYQTAHGEQLIEISLDKWEIIK